MKRINKADLPQKICVTCNRPFSWRKKWARDWANVKYCSRRCQGMRAKQQESCIYNQRPSDHAV